MIQLTKRMLVLSFDCLSAHDYAYIQNLPHFKDILLKGSLAPKVRTIYPSLTYPCHTTIVTGKYPKNHGIIHNTLIQPGRDSPDWNWYRNKIKGTTLYDEAQKAKMKTSALLWPVTGRAKIDYNLPEIFPNRWWQSQLLVSLFSGTPAYQWELNKRYGHIRNGLKQPELDDFVLASAVHTIDTLQPDLMLVHFTDLDSMRHYHGFASSEARAALKRHNDRLGEIVDALKRKDLYEETTIIILGDHSALDENKAIHMNVLLKENGWMTINKRGKISSWKVYCKSCDGSAYIYMNDKNDRALYEQVKAFLYSLQQNSVNGIEEVLSGIEAGEMGADPECSFMLEARCGFYFLDDVTENYLESIQQHDLQKKHILATHGYSPNKAGYHTIFMAAGKGIKKGVMVSSMNLVDIAPTLAALLGLDLGKADGQVISELLNK